ncbi:putative ferrichrome ABC transporter, ferrichrome-binding protein [Paenibacillus alvei TS-15]|uniref:Putative ferrichrome ABC transporter, ferrichrome-binding protein n=1 Tax=Paenibacillus alvei TS-15 TaxID=1117108 RepID=S9SPJ8_PAEAL|nr:ABC transporter substrate-binding protein [Paenibacillus alvei]EPY06604.1 putative ferrichrome ABC transporter, ferrichrome-binding protein [Paenibacillus alvei TS-15]
MKRWGICLIALLVIAAGALVGCSEKTPDGNKSSTNAVSGQQFGQPSVRQKGKAGTFDNGVWPRTITDSAGHEIILKERPERIAVLHPLYLDYFFALDTPPIASGNAVSAMKEFATLQPYVGTAEIADLGTGRDLNLEAVIASNPDVIVTFKGHIDANYEELSKIAPVIQIDYQDTWEQATMICAQIIGKEALAEQLIKDTKELIQETKEKLGDLTQKRYALLRVDGKSNFTAQGTKNTMYYNEAAGFGLMKPNGYPEDGSVLSMEALSEMNPDYLIIQHNMDQAKAAVQEKSDLAVWKSLKAVKENHVLYFDNSLNSGSVLAIRLAAENFMKLAGQTTQTHQ